MSIPYELYPIAVYMDRYSGTYSGGAWIAVAEADRWGRGINDLGSFGDDIVAMDWGHDIPDWAAVGDTPDLAVAALIDKVSKENG